MLCGLFRTSGCDSQLRRKKKPAPSLDAWVPLSRDLIEDSPGKSLTSRFQFFPFLSSGFFAPWLLLLGGGFSPFGVTTTVFGGLGGRSSLFWANAPVATKQHIAPAITFLFKSNIEFPVLLMHIKRAWEGE
jgi:hypothetical protein